MTAYTGRREPARPAAVFTAVQAGRQGRRLAVVDVERRHYARTAVPRVSQYHVALLPRLSIITFNNITQQYTTAYQ